MRSLVSDARQEACELCLEVKYINGTMDTWHVTLLIDGVGKAVEVGLAFGLLNRMNKKNGVHAPRTWKGR